MAPKKKVAGIVKLQIEAGKASPGQKIGSALGPYGANMMEFCKAFNAATETQRGDIIPVIITIYEDRSFEFVVKTPPAAELLKRAAGVAKGSGEPHKVKVGKVAASAIRDIAQTKLPDLNAKDLASAEKIIAGTARSMGITIE